MTPQNPAPVALAAEAARRLAALRAQRPLVQAITNYVSMDVAANALLAIGASPAMIHAPEEAEDFGAIANALVVNIGTLSTDWVVGMEAAAQVAAKNGRPWVLDPVGVGATRFRDETTRRLLALKPTIVRGNASEIMACARSSGCTTRPPRRRASTARTGRKPPALRRSRSPAARIASSPPPAPSISSPTASAQSRLPTDRR